MNRKLKKWTQKEESCLKRWFPVEGLKVQDRLPRRSMASIKTKALELGMDFMKESKKRTWTFEEEQVLIKNYNTITSSEILKLLPNRTRSSIYHKALSLGMLAEKSPNIFTGEEIELIRSGKEITELIKLLPRHSYSSIAHKRLSILGHQTTTTPWSKEETQILETYYPMEGAKVAERFVGRSTCSIYLKARKMKLKREK